MELDHFDIEDNEIRIISSNSVSPEPSADGDESVTLPVKSEAKKHGRRRRWPLVWLIALILIAVALILWAFLSGRWGESDDELQMVTTPPEPVEFVEPQPVDDSLEPSAPAGYVLLADTVVNRVGLSILSPVNLTPSLYVGTDVLNDSTVRFIVQAADIRGDNGGIVGAFVKEGELLSKGQGKSGFCAIIGGTMTIGVADSTPFLEQALESDGYFFRQFPLVVGGQLVENKQKGYALRRALAELNNQTVVILSNDRMTLNDFSKNLVDLGVTNAIYLVGGMGYGFAIGPDGSKTEFGTRIAHSYPNTNYLVWR